MDVEQKIPVGISACLLGQKVRYDGEAKLNPYITETLGQYFHWVPICPEAEAGLGTPRPSMHFEEDGDDIKLVQPKTGLDLTQKMTEFSTSRVAKVGPYDIYGYILKARSPSCGMERVKVYRGHGVRPHTNGTGVFAKALKEQHPLLPLEEEGRLCDPVLRENWVKRVFSRYQFHRALFPEPSMGKLVDFHARYKFAVLCHDEVIYRTMGRLVGQTEKKDLAAILVEYEDLLMNALAKKATPAKHTNVLEHLYGFFKKVLSKAAREAVLGTIRDYQEGFVPLIVPITLLRHYAVLHEMDYLMNQTYLNPHPKRLALLSDL